MLRHLHKVASVIEHLSTGRFKQAHEVFHQYGLSGTTLTDDQVGLAILEDGTDILQHFATFKALTQILYFYHRLAE